MNTPDPRQLSILDFTYNLPADRIAPAPLPDRDASRLLVYRQGTIADHTFRDLPAQLPANSLLVFNDTKVVRARLYLQKPTGGQVELFCLEPMAPHRAIEPAMQQTGECVWRCLVGNGKRWKTGVIETSFTTSAGDTATLQAEREAAEEGSSLIRFRWQPAELPFAEVLAGAGRIPLPPYLNREATTEDDERYQTVYATNQGAVAAPTAGLHFTDAVLADLTAHNIGRAQLTLHVGAGTFQPVKAEQMADHNMHSEPISASRQVLQQLLDQLPRPIIAVGTTSLRTLESLYWLGCQVVRGGSITGVVGQWEPYEQAEEIPTAVALQALLDELDRRGDDTVQASTQLLIAPGYRIRTIQGIITNFHQPESTLLLLISALIGDNWRRVYEHALANNYRFLSYGDSSLLIP